MTGPIDTIREALDEMAPSRPYLDAVELRKFRVRALAALTEVEHQLAARGFSLDEMQQVREVGREAEARAVAAETALAKHREASTTTIRKMGDALDRAQQKVRDQESRFTNPYRSDLDRAVAAERRADALADALRDFEAAVRVYDVMLNEPAAEGLMSAEDYSAYLRGAWLGVEEAAVVARAALDRHTPPACPRCGKPADTIASGGDLGDGVRYICPDGHPWGAEPRPRDRHTHSAPNDQGGVT